MKWRKTTEDRRAKRDHLMDIVNDFMGRLKSSTVCDRYRIAPVYFSSAVYTAEPQYSNPREVLVEDPVDICGGSKTAIAKALRKCIEIHDQFMTDNTLPDEKFCTVFLFTDGNDDVSGDKAVLNAASDLREHLKDQSRQPSLATVAFGREADTRLLATIASELSERQKRHLRNAQIYDLLPDKNKMFILGHSEGVVTRETVEMLKRFVWVLSKTVKEE